MKSLPTLMSAVLLVSCGFPASSRAPQATPQLSSQQEPILQSRTGGFAIWMPAGVERVNHTPIRICVGGTRAIHSLFAREGGAYWLVQYCDLSDDETQKLSASDILDQARDEALVDAFATLRAERAIALDRYAGKHIIADSALRTGGMGRPDGTYKARVFLVGNRVYRVAAYVFNENWGGNLERMDKFLESFVLLRR